MAHDTPEQRLEQARAQVRDRNPREALRTLDGLVAEGALGAHAQTLRGHVLRVLGNAEAAEIELCAVVDRADDPDWMAPAARALVELGWLRRQRDHADSERMMRRAVALADTSGDVETRVATRCALAEVEAMNGDPVGCDQALDEADALASDADSHARVLMTRGSVASALGRSDEAERAYRALARSARRGPSAMAHSAHTGLAKVLLGRGRPEEALEHARQAVALSEGWGSKRIRAMGYTLLGEVARGLGNLDDADRAYRAAEQIYEPEEGMAVLSRLNRAQVAVLAGELVVAEDLALGVRERMADHALGSAIALLSSLPAALARDDGVEVAERLAELEGRITASRAVHSDVAELAEVSADLATDIGGTAIDSAVRLRAVAHRQWTALGNTRRAAAASDALAALHADGGPIPVGGFLLHEELGRGGSGMVWRATHSATSEQVAVKLLSADSGQSTEALETFARELDAVARLDHPNIVWLLDHGTLDGAAAAAAGLVEGTPWLALELASAGTLDDVCGRWEWPRCAEALLSILDALSHAHARGIVHLDLKPSNILLDGPPSARVLKLADFGLARAPRFRGLRPAGTPAYMAPEHFQARPLGPWTDLYALGCLATALVQGAPPFELDSLGAMRAAHLTRLPPRLSPAIGVPPGLQAWLRRLLAKDPAQRFRHAADAAAALRALGSAPTGPSRPRRGSRPAPTSSRTTVVLPVEGVEALLTAVDDEGDLCPLPTPQVPMRWEAPAAPRRAGLLGAGLALVERRSPRPVAREHQRELLWAWLRQVSEQRRGALVVLAGPDGGGARHLAGWLVERAQEIGAADQVPSIAALRDRPGIIVLERVDEDPEQLVAARALPGADAAILGLVTVPPEHVDDVIAGLDEHVLVLDTGALDDDSVRAVLQTLLPLAPDLEQRLVAEAGGLPGRAIRRLRQLVSDGQLVPRTTGWDLRPGAG